MQIFLSIIVNIMILSVVLPLFYIFIVSKARERLERETTKKIEDELNALVHEFNRSAISNVALLEDAILRVRREYADIVNKENSKNNKTFVDTGKIERDIEDEIKEDIKATKREIELSNLDKIERDTKKINNTIKFEANNKKNTVERKVINIVVDDNRGNDNKNDNTRNESSDNSSSMNKAQIETALKKIKQNISITQEKKVRSDDNSIELIKKENVKKKIENTSNENIESINSVDSKIENKNKLIVELYKKGLKVEDIAIETKSSIAEVELVLDMEIKDN